MVKRIACTCCFVLALAANASADLIINGSFEFPALGGGTTSFQYNPVDPTGGWTFSGRSGVANGVFFIPPPPDGTQAAFLQQYSDQPNSFSSISQTLTGVTPDTFLLFDLAQRPGYGANPVTVTYAGVVLGTFTPSSTSFQQFFVDLGATAPSSGLLVFSSAATTTFDIDTAIDLVETTNSSPTPEPASALLLIPGLGVMAFLGFRRRVRA